MDAGGGQLEEGSEELVADDEDPGPGGGRPKDSRVLLQGGSPCGVAFQVEDMGTEPPHGAGPWKFSAQGCAADHWDAAKELGVGGLGLYTSVVSYGGGVL